MSWNVSSRSADRLRGGHPQTPTLTVPDEAFAELIRRGTEVELDDEERAALRR
jgi:hypothetical protein